jgi:hypothetical protein
MTTTDLLTAVTTNGGFTYSPTNDHLYEVGRDSGYAIAIPGTEHIVGSGDITREEFATAVADLLSDPVATVLIANGVALGGWYSPERNVYMVELTEIVHIDRTRAVEIGRSRNQEAIFDIATGEEIPTGGTGDARPAASDS